MAKPAQTSHALSGRSKTTMEAILKTHATPADVDVFLRDNADCTVFSFPKSGRTWLAFLTGSYAAQHIGRGDIADHWLTAGLTTLLPERDSDLIRAIGMARHDPLWAPYLIFRHRAGPSTPYYKATKTGSNTHKNVVLLRDPRDVVVSYYHHVVHKLKGRISSNKTERMKDTSLSEFIQSETLGFRRIVRYMTDWSEWGAKNGSLVVHYEDFRANTVQELTALLSWLGYRDINPEFVANAVESSSFEKLKQAEIQLGKGRTDPSRRRMRKGEIGGFRTEVTQNEADFMNDYLRATQAPALRRYLARTNPADAPQ